MIRKTIDIRSTGMLAKTGGASFYPVTIIYGENGCGKSTLAAILRSLGTGDPAPIRARRRLRSTEDPYVSLLVEGSRRPTTFDGTAWKGDRPSTEVFDREFVDRNVYVGATVEHEHKRALHEFVVGKEGIQLHEQIRSIDEQIASTRDKVQELAAEIQRLAGGGMKAEAVTGLPQLPDVDGRIATQEHLVNAARDANQVARQPKFEPLVVPEFDAGALRELLGRSLSEISSAAALRTRDQIEKYLGTGGEVWLSAGMKFLTGTVCPFCGTGITGNTLIEAYQQYFSEAYKRYCDEIDRDAAIVASWYGEGHIQRTIRVLEGNARLAEFWSRYGVEPPGGAPAIETIERLYESLGSAIGAELERKRAALLDSLNPSQGTVALMTHLQRLREDAQRYNTEVERANGSIERLKRDAPTADSRAVEAELGRLLTQRDRYRSPLRECCDQYLRALDEKKRLEDEKGRLQRELKQYSAGWFARYERRLNDHLSGSACGFSLTKTKTAYPGGKPRIEYALLVHGTELDPTPKRRVRPDEPHFGTTLSEGDKSTLAFAFFLAKLELDSDLENKIVVLDDPMTSLDRNRRHYTIERIVALSRRCTQLIVLTHDRTFAGELWDRLDPARRGSLQIERKSSDRSVLEAWNIEEAVRDGYFADYDRLWRFHGGEDDVSRIEVLHSVRPAVEEVYRRRFPRDVGRTDTLGQIAAKIRDAPSTSPLVGAKGDHEDLSSLNGFVTRYEHARDSQPAELDVSDAELRRYVKIALSLIHGSDL